MVAVIDLTGPVAALELILFLFIFLMLGVAAIAMWLEDAPVRDEDEELGVTRWLV